MRNLSTGTWASVGGSCPVTCKVEGADLTTVVIGDDDQNLELVFNAKGLRKLAEASTEAVAEMDAAFERENAGRAQAECGEFMVTGGDA